jgi:hypothetical protein
VASPAGSLVGAIAFAGANDDFAAPPELSAPSPELDAQLVAETGATSIGFDDVPGENGVPAPAGFGHSFVLPRFTAGGLLQLHMKAGPGADDPDDELRLVLDGGAFAWTHRIQDLPGIDTWDAGDEAVVGLELGNLPPSPLGVSCLVDLFAPSAASERRLDVSTLGHTAVDDMQLTAHVTLPNYFGFWTGDGDLELQGGPFSSEIVPGDGPIQGNGSTDPADFEVPGQRYSLAASRTTALPGHPQVAQVASSFSLSQPETDLLGAGGGPGSFTAMGGGGTVTYTAGPQQFGGTLQLLRQGMRELVVPVTASPPLFAHYAGAFTALPPGAGSSQVSTIQLGSGLVTQSPVVGSLGSIVSPGTPVGTLPPPPPTTATVFPFTTGVVRVTVSNGATPTVVTLSGSDARTAMGHGVVSLVAGGVVHSPLTGSFPRTARLTLTIPEPAVPLGLAAAAGLLAALRRRRSRRPR